MNKFSDFLILVSTLDNVLITDDFNIQFDEHC